MVVRSLGLLSADRAAACGVIADHLGADLAEVVEPASFRDLGADSLDLVSLTMRLEDAFDVEIRDDVEICLTVGDAMTLLGQALAARRGPAAAGTPGPVAT